MLTKEKLEIIESITLRNAIIEAWQARKKIAILMVALAAISGVIGFTQSKMLPKTNDGKAVAKYEEALANYDKACAEAKKNLAMAELQLKKQQEYIDKSPYMQIDPQKQQWGELSYRVDAPQRMGDVIHSYNNFVNRSWLAKELAAKYKAEPAEYIKEGLWSGNNGNMWTITFIRKDEKQIKELLPLIKEAVENYKKSVRFEHSLTLVKEINYVRVDMGTLKNQNGHRDTLRRFTNDVANYNRQLVDIEKQKIAYERMYEPKKYSIKSPVKTAVSYAGFGAILGLVASLAGFTLKQIMSNKVKAVEELLGLGIPVLSIASAKGYEPKLERTVAELSLLAQKQGAQSLYLGCLAKETPAGIIQEYADALAAEKIQLLVSRDIAHEAEELKQFVKAGKAVALVKLGETSYQDIEGFLHLCKKYDVEVWGFIVSA